MLLFSLPIAIGTKTTKSTPDSFYREKTQKNTKKTLCAPLCLLPIAIGSDLCAMDFKPVLIITVLMLLSFTTYAQQPGDRAKVNEFLVQQEQRKRAMLMQELDSGVLLMENAEYAAADKKFRHVLDNIKGVPSDLTFYFGKNSFYLEKYKQCIDWLNKYIQLKGVSGQYSQEAVELKKKAEAEFVKEKSKNAAKVGDVLSMDYDIDCGPTGKVTCPVCKGDHVIVKKGAFGDEYKTCPYCNEHGILTCEEYNKLIRGQLKPKP